MTHEHTGYHEPITLAEARERRVRRQRAGHWASPPHRVAVKPPPPPPDVPLGPVGVRTTAVYALLLLACPSALTYLVYLFFR